MNMIGDLLNFGAKAQAQAAPPDDGNTIYRGEHTIKRSSGTPEDKKMLWNPLRFVDEAQEAAEKGKDPVAGIITPGQVDKEHTEFLKKTTMVE